MTEQDVIDFAYEFRKRVSDEMFKRDWKHKDLADAIGVEPDAITYALKQFGNKNKPYQTRQKIRELFGIHDI